MNQIWTIIFVTLLAIAMGIAAWHDREEEKRKRRKRMSNDKNEGEN